MLIQKVRIVSKNICYGPEPLPDDEVEQHLAVSSSGRVWFTGYKYAKGFGKFEICRREQFEIKKLVAKEIMELFSQYLNCDRLGFYITDIGDWEMVITDIEGKEHDLSGPLCGGLTVGDTNLTYYLREHIPVNGLLLFGDK